MSNDQKGYGELAKDPTPKLHEVALHPLYLVHLYHRASDDNSVLLSWEENSLFNKI